MTNSAKPVLAEGSGGETSTSQHFFFSSLSLPPISDNTTDASLVECVNFLFLHILQGPRFAAVQTVNFVLIISLGLCQTLLDSLAKVPEALPIQQLISISIDAFDAVI